MSKSIRLVVNNQSHEMAIKEYQGQRVVTFGDIDELHQRPENTAARNFSANRDKFIEETDFFKLSFEEARSTNFVGRPNSQGLVLITESGYLMLVKSFTDDLAWTVQRELVNGYFRNRVSAAPTPAEALLQAVQMMVAHERQLTALANRQQAIEAKVEAIAARSEEAEEDIAALPHPDAEVPALTRRAQINRLVRDTCHQNNLGHRFVWNRLYLEFRDRHHIDLKARAKGREGPLDVAERLDFLEDLYSLAHHLFGKKQEAATS